MEKLFSYEKKMITLKEEYLDQIKANAKAWDYYHNMAPGYKKQTNHWVMHAKREETRLRRLKGLLLIVGVGPIWG